MMAEERDFHRKGGQTDQPHGTEGPPNDRNPDRTRHEKPGTAREAQHSTNPTEPLDQAKTRSGAP